ncbi:MAG TPA: DUF1223 domain-containing protein [Opitutaceae bacterium]|nr:DUF1223 domain-containing protein [Opitutaceae bacterium]
MALLIGMGVAASLKAGATKAFTSGLHAVSLIELYTSEGCSSCPPAEKWLGELRDDPGLWKTFVPVAFHVTYWDHLGWRDIYASKTYTQRQYAYAERWASSSVYTPCFIKGGREWKPTGGQLGSVADASPGLLTAIIDSDGSGTVAFVPASTESLAYDVYVVRLGGGIENAVRGGENAGRKLRHDFVALSVGSLAMSKQGAVGFSAKFDAPPANQPNAPRHALAVWVVKHGDLTPIQAAGGWLD